MISQKSSCSRILAIWVVLFAFFFGMVLPSVAVARQEKTIATEGDPGDGLENDSGGAGGGSGLEGPVESNIILKILPLPNRNESQGHKNPWFVVPPQMDMIVVPYFDGFQIYFHFIQHNSGSFGRGRN